MGEDLRSTADVPDEADLAVDHLGCQEVDVFVVACWLASGRKVEEQRVAVVLVEGVRQRYGRLAARLQRRRPQRSMAIAVTRQRHSDLLIIINKIHLKIHSIQINSNQF